MCLYNQKYRKWKLIISILSHASHFVCFCPQSIRMDVCCAVLPSFVEKCFSLDYKRMSIRWIVVTARWKQQNRGWFGVVNWLILLYLAPSEFIWNTPAKGGNTIGGYGTGQFFKFVYIAKFAYQPTSYLFHHSRKLNWYFWPKILNLLQPNFHFIKIVIGDQKSLSAFWFNEINKILSALGRYSLLISNKNDKNIYFILPLLANSFWKIIFRDYLHILTS